MTASTHLVGSEEHKVESEKRVNAWIKRKIKKMKVTTLLGIVNQKLNERDKDGE
jgi:hypothetical protein